MDKAVLAVNDYCGGDGSVGAEGLLAREGCTPGRSLHNAAMSQGTGWHPAGGLVINSAVHNAPRANSAALTSNARANQVALAVPTLIRPMDPIDISAASRETALLIADARPLYSVGTEASVTDVSGVIVATSPMASTVIPGTRSVTAWNPLGYGRISSSPIPAKAGPAIKNARGPTRAAMRPT